MDINFVNQMHELLVQATANDTLQIKAATASLNKDFFSDARCIPGLTEIVASSPQDAVKQLAAVELRKRVSDKSGEMWLKVSPLERDQIKAKLPQITVGEQNKLVRHSSARVISAIASIELSQGTWPDLLPILNQCATSPDASTREVGIYIIFTVLEAIVEGFQEHLASFFKLFEQLVVDNESREVRVTTVRALGIIAQYLDADDANDIKTFQALLPSMIQVIGECVQAGDEQNARHLFDVFETLLILEIPLLGQSVPDLVQFFLQCGANRSFQEELRVMSLNALSWTVKYKKSKIQNANLAAALLEGLMPITTEDEPDDIDDDVPSRSALRIIDSLSTSLPPSQIFPPLRHLILQYMSSPLPELRRGAMLSLGVAVEGCSEYMTPLMSQVWPLIEAGLRDEDVSVRRASCIAVGCLCEWVEDECVDRHAILVPAIMNLMNNPETQKAACTALDGLLEILQDVIDQYLSPLMTQLTTLLDTAPLRIKSVATGAIGSAAHASKQKFLPYFHPIMQKIIPFLELGSGGGPVAAEEIELRGIAMDAIGTFASSLGGEVFKPYYEPMMQKAVEGVSLGDSNSTTTNSSAPSTSSTSNDANSNPTNHARLKETSFLFFGVMSGVYGSGDEFVKYLPGVVQMLIASCKQEEKPDPEFEEHAAVLTDSTNTINTGNVTFFASGDTPANAISLIDRTASAGSTSTNADNTSAEIFDLNINSALAVEKEIAADTLGTICSNVGTHFLPFVEETTFVLVELLAHYYEGIRKSAVDSVLELVRCFYTMSGSPEWVPGVGGQVPLHKNVSDLIEHIVPPLLEMYESEDDKSVVASLCAGLADTIKLIGPEFLRGYQEKLFVIPVQILEQKALCQQDPDQDDSEEPPEDQAEYDSVLIGAAGDLVASFALVLGPDFANSFGGFFTLIKKYTKKSRSLSDRSAAIGCLAEIIAGMKEAITPFTEQLYKLITAALQDQDTEVQSNAAYAIGLLVENSTMDLSGQYPELLLLLQPFFQPDAATATTNGDGKAIGSANQGKGTARDNAAGAVSRLILRSSATLPLSQILPVLISVLPLHHDYLENRPLFRAFFHLFRTQPNALAPYLNDGSLLRVFKFVLDSEGGVDMIGDEVRTELRQLVGILYQQDAGRIQEAGLAVYI